MNEIEQIDFEDMEASKPLPPDREMRRLAAILQAVETTAAWDAGCLWRAKILHFYGARVLRAIEQYECVPVVDTPAAWPGDAWVYTGPMSTAREAVRRKAAIRRLYRGE